MYRLGLAIALAVTALLVTFATPVRLWRTGEPPARPLPLTPGAAQAMPERVWIDTDAACGSGPRVDPDDCFALLLLARSARLKLVGLSTVFGNASIETVEATVRHFRAALSHEGVELPPDYRGSAAPISERSSNADPPAHAALREALREGPLTIVALGPLTNVAAALRGRAELAANIAGLVVVMGRRNGHLFHPSEGKADGVLFGHGPVFRDFNYAQDPNAAEMVARMRIPMSMVPYEVARSVVLTAADLQAMEGAGIAAAWVGSRAREWIQFWRDDIGINGFYPFDLLAAAYIVEPGMFDCARVKLWIRPAPKPLAWLGVADSLVVGLDEEKPRNARSAAEVTYCPRTQKSLHPWLMRQLVNDPAATPSNRG